MKKWLAVKSPHNKRWRLISVFEACGVEILEFYSARIAALEKEGANSWRAISEEFFFSNGELLDKSGKPYIFETPYKLRALFEKWRLNRALRKTEQKRQNENFWQKLAEQYE